MQEGDAGAALEAAVMGKHRLHALTWQLLMQAASWHTPTTLYEQEPTNY